MSSRVLSQNEIDSVFKKKLASGGEDEAAKRAQAYDFRRPDRIAKDQLRAIHLLHENFGRNLASSLSAYLRAYVLVNLVSVEQLSFAEFTQCLPSPTSAVALGLAPYDGAAVLELNPTLVFPILEMLLGGSGKSATKISREVTEIEQTILESLLRIILQDLRSSWEAVAKMEFSIDSHETEPQLLQILAPTEAVVAISMEVKIGDLSGMMNIGIPSIVVKMLRHKFDQQWSVRKAEATQLEHARFLNLIRAAQVNVDTRLTHQTLRVDRLLDLKEGDILAFDHPLAKPFDVTVNGAKKFRGEIVVSGRKRAVEIREIVVEG
jgi:flagellar motor switch protein FliM